jgi:hypothetical protein
MDALFLAIDNELNNPSNPRQEYPKQSPLYRKDSVILNSINGNPSPLYKNLFRNDQKSQRNECLEDDGDNLIDRRGVRGQNLNYNSSDIRGNLNR